MRELLPEGSRRFLYPRGDGEAFRRAVADVFALSAEERRAVILENLAVARIVHPRNVAQQLAAIYETCSRHARAPL
jgi:hypothetical protein